MIIMLEMVVIGKELFKKVVFLRKSCWMVLVTHDLMVLMVVVV